MTLRTPGAPRRREGAVGLGLAVFPEPAFLRRAARAMESADYLEVAPETLWTSGCAPSPRRAPMLDLVRRSGLPVVGHGVGLSLGGTLDDERFERHLDGIRRDHGDFGFAWYSDHLGFVGQPGRFAALPLPLPPTAEAVARVAGRLRRLREIVPEVAFENSANLFVLGAAQDEPAFLGAILDAADCGLVLDLHNVHVQALNLGVDPDAYLDAIDLRRVAEIHVSGGNESDPEWLPSRRRLRLDSHDGPVPEDVWRSLERTLPRCPGVRGVTLEWIADGLRDEDVPALGAQVTRLRAVLDAHHRAAPPRAHADTVPPQTRRAPPLAGRDGSLAVVERILLDALHSDRPLERLAADAAAAGDRLGAAERDWLGAVDTDGFRATSLVVRKLRFERVLRGDAAARREFDAAPAEFVSRWRRYERAVPPSAETPADEAAAFRAHDASR